MHGLKFFFYPLTSEVNLAVTQVAHEININGKSPEPRPEFEGDHEIIWIDLVKGPQGLGFSILDQEDKALAQSFVHIRGLVPKGVAEQDGRLKPMDRVLYVNDVHFDMSQMSLQECVHVLKGMAQTSHKKQKTFYYMC